MPNFANVQLPASLPSPAAPIRSAGPVRSASQSSSNASTPPSSSPSPRSIILTDVPPHVSPARVSAPSKPIGVTMSTEESEKSRSKELQTSLPAPVPPAGHDLNNARAKVTQEITQEFALIMESGSLRASEGAALAAGRVLERHRMGAVSSGLPQNAA